MDESVEQFRGWCLEAFAFLRQEHGFSELKFKKGPANLYHVRFSNGVIELAVKGEGYGADAYVYYLNADGVEVPSRFLEPDWDPVSFGRKKRKKGPRLTQPQQIFYEAGRIKVRDGDILRGDYTHLDDVSARWKDVKEKLFGRV